MRTESNVKPSKYEINDLPNGTTEILFCENIEENGSQKYTFDFHRLVVPTRPNLDIDIENNYLKWIALAKI